MRFYASSLRVFSAAVLCAGWAFCASVAMADTPDEKSGIPARTFIPLPTGAARTASIHGPNFIPLRQTGHFMPMSPPRPASAPVASGASSLPQSKVQAQMKFPPSTETPPMPPHAKAAGPMSQQQASQLLSVFSAQ